MLIQLIIFLPITSFFLFEFWICRYFYDVCPCHPSLSLWSRQFTVCPSLISTVRPMLVRSKFFTSNRHTDDNPVLRARSVFNGPVQRGLYSKEQTILPTVLQDAFIMTCIVGALEQRNVATTDIKEAYFNAKMKDMVMMKIKGPEVRTFCELDPSLEIYVTLEGGCKVLYVQIEKPL